MCLNQYGTRHYELISQESAKWVSGADWQLQFVGCLTSRQQASVSQGRICSDNFTCCHTEIEVADPTFYLTQSQYTDTGPTSPSADPVTPGAWQGSHWSANFWVTGMTRPRKNPVASAIRTRDLPSRGGRLTTRSTRRWQLQIKPATPLCQSILTPGRPVLALIL